MLSEQEFFKAVEETFAWLEEMLEAADAQGALEVERGEGVLTVTLPGGHQYVVNRHAPSHELWVASPVSGGLHFSHAGGREWKLADGRLLAEVLAAELRQLAGIEVR